MFTLHAQCHFHVLSGSYTLRHPGANSTMPHKLGWGLPTRHIGLKLCLQFSFFPLAIYLSPSYPLQIYLSWIPPDPAHPPSCGLLGANSDTSPEPYHMLLVLPWAVFVPGVLIACSSSVACAMMPSAVSRIRAQRIFFPVAFASFS